MFKKIKQLLGIEGIKMKVILPEEISAKAGSIEGNIKFTTMNTQRIAYIEVKLIERYTHGRGKKAKRTEEFLLGKVLLDDGFMVYPEESVSVKFELPFKKVQSNMDALQERGGLLGGLARAAKASRGVKSEFRVEAEAKVAGTALSPFDREIVNFV